MKKLYQSIDRFCVTHPGFGIPNLMLYIVAGNAIVYVLMLITEATGYSILNSLYFSPALLLNGQIWRIVTFIFVPNTTRPLGLIISLYFYYWVGGTLERQWGTARFNIYYFSGALLTVIGTIIASLITGTNLVVYGTTYVNLSMFFAFAVLFPNVQVLLFFIIPIKMKWLAFVDAALFLYDAVTSALAQDWAGVILPIIALLNFAIFAWPTLAGFTQQQQYQHSRKTVQFKKAVKEQQKEKGYHHKCAVCGRTDTDYPNLQFRYCSKCAGYHCFCQDHIFTHVHFTE